ncbi:2Fe-2S iron-sulfur cluster-binding protein [Aquipseudomonas ullengensis]|uniref:2Fe-2S iron-sulfur cluster binding domain-containing protein n=1 Tax=Aquipseudomonas ullengensis TaxID=2759166 RepID=A0A7W4LQC5_9GAMM|nr:2Fe-2S iron-sulfur cluster-binding protein [Pseudomonas ullengensis]MBB2497394.1 2Fe-2S iron-sulfur cluster binding domain-containing protein [Pseudomonas ullengensis]
MPTITFIQHDGSPRRIEAHSGQSLMQAAQANLVPGILGDCGGSCSCATCHCYIEGAWAEALPEPAEDERLMLDGALHVLPSSRLACQVVLSEALDGLVVTLPASQL